MPPGFPLVVTFDTTVKSSAAQLKLAVPAARKTVSKEKAYFIGTPGGMYRFGNYRRVSSTRRLRARPASVAFVSRGAEAPKPEANKCPSEMPSWISAVRTAAARRVDKS